MNHSAIVAAYTAKPPQYDIVRAAWKEVKAQYPQLFDGNDIGTETGPGWWPLLIEAFEGLSEILVRHPELQISVAQIKEKFGTLRFYIDTKGATPEVREQIGKVIGEAEGKSHVTCEFCGEPGERRMGNWLLTLCDEHEALVRASGR